MAIFKLWGIELRTGKDQTTYQKRIPRVPKKIDEAEVSYVEPDDQDNEVIEAPSPSPKSQSVSMFARLNNRGLALNNIKIAKPHVTLRDILVKEVIYPSLKSSDNIWSDAGYERYVLAAQKMLATESFFSICDVDKLIGVCRLSAYDQEIYSFLYSMHCAHYAKMTDNEMKMLFAAVTHVFTDGRIGSTKKDIKKELKFDVVEAFETGNNQFRDL